MSQLLKTLALAAVLALPAVAQFAITVQENGQALGVSNGGTIAFNAPGVGQGVTASVTVTFLGTGSVAFSTASIAGSTGFTGVPSALTLAPFQSVTVPLFYNPATAAQATAQLLWPYTLTALPVGTAPPVMTAGAISFNLVGTAPNVVVGQVPGSNAFNPVPAGGTIQFPDTLVGGSSPITIGISNPGSGPATITSIVETGAGYQLVGIPLFPLTLAAGSQLNVIAQFNPASTGLQTAGLQITFASGSYSASLSGRGVSSFLSYQLVEGSQTSTITPNQTISFPDTNVGAKSTVTIQFQNMGSTATAISAIGLSGAGFSISDGPFLPITLQPQQSNSVTLTWSPTQPGLGTGRLIIGSDNFALSGNALGALLQYSYQAGSTTTSIAAGGTIAFPPVSPGQPDTIGVSVTNTGTVVAPVVSIGIPGTSATFVLSNLPAIPLQLAPNATISFNVTFTPQAAGQSTGTLLINSQSFTLSGISSSVSTGTQTPLPSYQFTGASGTLQPFQQPAIGLSLSSAYPVLITGTLVLADASNSFFADPAVQFSTGGRTVAFTIPANSTQAVFPNGSTQVRLQTGTVASILTITPDFTIGTAPVTDITPPNPPTLQLTIPSGAPVLLTIGLTQRTTTGFVIQVTGYSTTRYMDHLSFQFTPANGSTLKIANTTVDVSATARLFFQTTGSQALGGEFTAQIPFTLTNGSVASPTNDLTKNIASVAVTGANEIGTSNSLQVILP